MRRKGMLQMTFNRGQCGQENWRRIKGFAHLADAGNGIKSQDGERQIQPKTTAK
jgi:putative transposase